MEIHRHTHRLPDYFTHVHAEAYEIMYCIEGGYEFTTDRIVPELNGTPFEQYAFTNFNFRVDTDGTVMRCNFVCTFKGIPHQIATYGSTFPPIE